VIAGGTVRSDRVYSLVRTARAVQQKRNEIHGSYRPVARTRLAVGGKPVDVLIYQP
jgi:hypothetical protein